MGFPDLIGYFEFDSQTKTALKQLLIASVLMAMILLPNMCFKPPGGASMLKKRA